MPRKKIVRGEGTTPQQILAAATRRFSEASYDNVSLRDIASDVGIDVAYVHRSFGSKELLFREVLDGQRIDQDFSGVTLQDLPASLAKRMIERDLSADTTEPDPLMILLLSLGSPSASGLVNERLHTDFIHPLQEKLGDTCALRASLVLSLLIGLSILRNLAPTSAVSRDTAEAIIARAIESILERVRGHDVKDASA